MQKKEFHAAHVNEVCGAPMKATSCGKLSEPTTNGGNFDKPTCSHNQGNFDKPTNTNGYSSQPITNNHYYYNEPSVDDDQDSCCEEGCCIW